MRLRINDISLKQKLVFSYGMLVVISVLVLGAAFYSSMQRYVYEQAGESYRQTLEQAILNTEYKLNSYDELLNQFVTDKQFVGAVSNAYTSPGDSSFEFLNTISQIFGIREKGDSVADLILYKNNPSLPESGDSFIDIGYASQTSWYKRYFEHTDAFTINDYIALSKQKVWTVTDEINKPDYRVPGRNRIQSEEPLVAVIKPIIYNYEEITGIIELFIHYSAIFGEIIVPGTPPDDHIIVADDRERIIFSSFSSAASGREALPVSLSGQIGNRRSGNFTIRENGVRKMVLFNRGKHSNWLYLRVIPVERLFSGAKAVRDYTIGVAGLCMLVSFLLALALARMIARRLSVLSRRMERVEDLTLDMKVDIDGRDEIGALARSYNRMIRKIRELIEQLTVSQQTQKESELKALQTQVNPHFLYNTLATINWMAMDGQNDKIMAMVNHLAVFYRLSLNKGRSFLTVGEEISHLQAYTEIQKIRLEDKISVAYDIEPGIEKCQTLKLILQPFVENAILHGVESKDGTTNISIRAFRKNGYLQFEIADDGSGMEALPTVDLYPVGSGYGIRNVHERIRLQYGPEFGVFLQSEKGRGTLVTVIVPIIVDE